MVEETGVAATRRRLLEAARTLLVAEGPAKMHHSAIARAAGVTRQTVYRYWPTRRQLLADVVLAGPSIDVHYPGPGSDAARVITEFLFSLRDAMNDEALGSALMAVTADAGQDEVCAAALRTVNDDRRAALNSLIVGSGLELDTDDFAQLCGPIMFQRFIARRNITDRLIRNTVASWAAGLPATQPS